MRIEGGGPYHGVALLGSDFRIPQAKLQQLQVKALSRGSSMYQMLAIVTGVPRGGAPGVSPLISIWQVMSAAGWPLVEGAGGDVVGIACQGGERLMQPNFLFGYLAPFVEKGCWVELVTYGDRYKRLVFDGEGVHTLLPYLMWDEQSLFERQTIDAVQAENKHLRAELTKARHLLEHLE